MDGQTDGLADRLHWWFEVALIPKKIVPCDPEGSAGGGGALSPLTPPLRLDSGRVMVRPYF